MKKKMLYSTWMIRKKIKNTFTAIGINFTNFYLFISVLFYVFVCSAVSNA